MTIQPLRSLPENHQGQDFVVGDIHGCYGTVMQQLSEAGFDPRVDRLLCVGDLVDRGPASARCLQLVHEPWFHAVWGNHEDLMLRALHASPRSSDYRLWMLNGGDWAQGADPRTLAEAIRSHAASASLAMEVPVDGQRVGLVHAEVPGNDWGAWSSRLSPEDREQAIWGRSTIMEVLRGHPAPPVTGIDLVFFGHTPLTSPVRLSNRVYLDTGAGYPGGEPIVLKLAHALSQRFDSTPAPFRPRR